MVLPFLLARLGRREWRALAANTQGRQEDFKDILVLVVPLLGNFSSCLRWSRCCFFWGKSLKLFSIGMVVVLAELTTRKFVKPEIVFNLHDWTCVFPGSVCRYLFSYCRHFLRCCLFWRKIMRFWFNVHGSCAK